MTTQIKEMHERQKQALPKNAYEFAAWFIMQFGFTGVVIIACAALWWNNERRSDEMKDLIRANVTALQQTTAEIRASDAKHSEGIERMGESVGAITQDLKQIRINTEK